LPQLIYVPCQTKGRRSYLQAQVPVGKAGTNAKQGEAETCA